MIVYQPNFLFLEGVKACLFALSLLNKIHLTHIESKKTGLDRDFTRYFSIESKN
ncbi:hypothetical protein BSBH6_00029 [Bacillus subtilis]|nr:hypothetical protein BSBH6_00029 [Bacillus subtilis]